MQTDNNYFELFQLEAAFDIDLKQLAAQYRQMQREFHPDKFSHKSASEQLRASQFSALLNDAYLTLKSVVERGKYLLKLMGHQLPDNHTINDTLFLMMQLELREELEAIVSKADETQLEAFLKNTQSLLAEKYKEINQTFSQNPQDLASTVLALIHQYQFIEKLYKEAEAEEEKLLEY